MGNCFKSNGNDCDSSKSDGMRGGCFKYVGESSRPFRMRVKEHHENLRDLKPKSFMLSHWMSQHATQMVPPVFEFRIIGRYRDCLSRQVAEALLIEDRGNLNKKSEFTSNHISRLESGLSQWEKERAMEVESNERANFRSNINNFINVIKNVRSLITLPDPVNICRKRQNTSSQTHRTGPKQKLRRMMNTSTPQWKSREPNVETYDEVSPIKQTFVTSNVEVRQDRSHETSSQSNNSDIIPTTLVETGLSPQVRKLLIIPRNETEFMEMRRLIRETINLTRAAMDRGLIPEDGISRYEDLFENSIYKPYPSADRFSLSLLLAGLNLDDWERDDIYADFGIDRSTSGKSSILAREEKLHDMSWDLLSKVDEKNIDLISTDLYGHCQGGELITQELVVVDNIINNNSQEGELITQKLDTMGSAVNDCAQEGLITQELEVVENIVSENKDSEADTDALHWSPRTPALPTQKRKQLSPYGETQVARALKLGKGNDSSPILRDNGKFNASSKQSTNSKLGLTTPKQTKRKPVKKIRRCLNPDNKQLLIDSMFSPRTKLGANDDTADSTASTGLDSSSRCGGVSSGKSD